MTLPTIHRNGTHAGDLLEGVLDAKLAINDAIAKLREAMPNGRDYYPQGNDAINQALREHAAREQRLSDVIAELDQIAEHIARHT